MLMHLYRIVFIHPDRLANTKKYYNKQQQRDDESEEKKNGINVFCLIASLMLREFITKPTFSTRVVTAPANFLYMFA